MKAIASQQMLASTLAKGGGTVYSRKNDILHQQHTTMLRLNIVLGRLQTPF